MRQSNFNVTVILKWREIYMYIKYKAYHTQIVIALSNNVHNVLAHYYFKEYY
jgi:hypothetical protein